MKNHLEIESKYSAQDINLMEFKALASKLKPKSFLYVESSDVYYVKSETEFLRYRMPATSDSSKRAELTFKKKHSDNNNIVRTEVNLRVDKNDEDTVVAFCEGLGYQANFKILKLCHIYYFEDGNIVFYSVVDEDGKFAHFVEIEASEEKNFTPDQGGEVIRKYEELMAPLGINAQKRMKLSLYERYRKEKKEA
jgi:predicted adenylyl cyclase CyaB